MEVLAVVDTRVGCVEKVHEGALTAASAVGVEVPVAIRAVCITWEASSLV
jgi:hypothetical protein